MNRKELALNIRVTRTYIMRLMEVGRQFDINKNGLYDASGGMAINIWCSPEDKPTCWNAKIDAGSLNHPREFVGTLRLEWIDDNHATLHVEASPYELSRNHKSRPTDDDLDSCLTWLTEKANDLFRLADVHPDILGTQCPFCKHILPNGELLNDLIEHIRIVHHIRTRSVTLGDPTTIDTDRGVYKLKNAIRPRQTQSPLSGDQS